MAEASLESTKGYVIEAQADAILKLEELAAERRENHALRREVSTLRSEIRRLTGSPTDTQSPESNGGSTKEPTARVRKRRNQ